MQSEKKLEWLEFELLSSYPHLRHAVFTKHGGKSSLPFASLNLSETVGDDFEFVKQNREIVRKKMKLSQIIYARQNHGVMVHRITSKNLDKPLSFADALFTTEKNIGLAVTHADCQAAIFYDPVHEVIAVAHAGWKGSVANIYAQLIQVMHRDVGVQAHNLLVCISPSLGPEHAEYKNYRQEFPQYLWPFQEKPNHFNFWEISKKQLMDCGILEKNIEIAETCTVCNSDDYFSYRRNKGCGRNATIIGLT